MSDSNLPVTSREYKLMLNPDRFRNREKGKDGFLDLLRFLIEKEHGRYVEQAEIDKKKNDGKAADDKVGDIRRVTTYLDTPEFAFREHGWILRAREELDSKEEDEKAGLNLKYRGADRYLSTVQDVSSPQKGKPKFEEDVLPPFRSAFSRSNTLKSATPLLVPGMDVDAAAKLFPALGIPGVAGSTRIVVANDFTAHELVMHIGGFEFDEGELVTMSLSFWYLQDSRVGWPMVGEFSFDYEALKAKKKKKDGEGGKEEAKAGEGGKEAAKDGDVKEPSPLEQFPRKTVEGTNRFFRSLQLQGGWLDLSGTTKSAFALSGM